MSHSLPPGMTPWEALTAIVCAFEMFGNCSSILLLLVYHINMGTNCARGEQEGIYYFYENRGSIGPQSSCQYSDYIEGSVILYCS